MATNEEQTAVDPLSRATAARPSQPPPIPQRRPTGTPSIPLSDAPVDAAAFTKTVTGRTPTASLVRGDRPTRVPPPLPRAITNRAPTTSSQTMMGSPAIGRTPMSHAVVSRAPTNSGSQTTMGLASPVVAPSPLEAPVVGRAPSQQLDGPAIGRTPTRSSALQPGVGRAPTNPGSGLPSMTRAPTGSTVIPVPPLAVPVEASPSEPIAKGTSIVERPPTTVAFSGLPPAIAAAIAAAPPSARAAGPHLALPPYVPAPNVGDPGEAIETVRVEKFELTELVDKYATLPVERVVEIDTVPRGFDARKVGGVARSAAPLIGGVALVLTFVIGFLMFDGEGRTHTKPVTAPPAAATVASALPSAANAASNAVATPAVASKPDATTDSSTTDSSTKADVSTKPDATPAPKAAALTSVPAPAAKPVAAKSPRGKIYISSNKPAQIFLDGKSANATTPRQLRVSPGKHKVTLWDTASGKTHTQVIDVPANKVVSVSKKFD